MPLKREIAEHESVKTTEDFDYWLYVVEDVGEGSLNVLPIRNPAMHSAKFEFRGGTWRHLAIDSDVVSVDEVTTNDNAEFV